MKLTAFAPQPAPSSAPESSLAAASAATCVDPTRRFATLTLVRGALVSLAIALVAGVFAVLHYLPGFGQLLAGSYLGLPVTRPLHTIFGTAWIFLGGLAAVHHWLEGHAGRPSSAERMRLRVGFVLFALSGVAILATLPFGITSGREYLEYHPLISIPILLGWLLLAWNFLAVTVRGFFDRPIYVTMWVIGMLFFVYTFIEQHAWLLPGVFADPVIDLRVQWKACGTLVGSFNLFVYGTLIWSGEQLSGSERYARSRLAYALFGVGLLNSFTNFAHHTYHVPQSAVVKWISFAVSMTEAVILLRVVIDLTALVRLRHDGQFHSARFFLGAAKWWTAGVLITSILLSVPPLNAVVHGTQVVTAHAMGAEIGIDTMGLFAGITLVLGAAIEERGARTRVLHSAFARAAAIAANVAAAVLVSWLTVSGYIVGVTRYLGSPVPGWLADWSPALFAFSGFGFAAAVSCLLGIWLYAVFVTVPIRRAWHQAASAGAAVTNQERRQ